MLNARVILTDAANERVDIMSDSDYLAVEKALFSLENTNEAHPAYDPDYPAAPAPVPCRVVHVGSHSLYFVVQEEEGAVVVFAVEPAKADPRARFANVEEPELLEKVIKNSTEG